MNGQSLADHLRHCLDLRDIKLHSIAGGDAASAWRLDSSSTRCFVKTTPPPSPFAAEALGLQKLKQAQGVRVPEVLHQDAYCLVLEWLDLGSPAPDFQTTLGQQLAETHRFRENTYGFDLDHTIGLTPQINLPRVPADAPSDWPAFWWTHRLEPMIRRLADNDLAHACGKLESRMDPLLLETGAEPCLLHGDLWSGNRAADGDGQPVMFDPAPYFGHREADLGMTRLFGGFTQDFYRAYHEAWPLVEGWEERIEFYMLYHVLNHVVLFGSAYTSHARRLIQRFS